MCLARSFILDFCSHAYDVNSINLTLAYVVERNDETT